MAKVRVYELAKELDLESKQLVEKLTAGGMDIKNYMSTLDEQSVVRAREIVSGAVSEVVVEKRIKPTVIRRRKKVVRVEQTPPETVVDEEKTPEEKVLEEKGETKEIPDVEDVQKKEPELKEKPSTPVIADGKEDVSAPPEIPLAETKEVTPELRNKKAEKPVKQTKAKLKRGKKKKVDQPAKIIMSPEEGPLRGLLAKKAEAKKKVTPAKAPSIKPPLGPPKDKGEKPKKGIPPKKKKGRKGTKAEDTPARGTFRRQKKEVYERADLYGGRPRKRKGPKGGRKRKETPRNFKHTEITVPKAIKRRIKVQELVTVVDLAKAMGTKAAELMKRLINLGVMTNINQPIDFETASVVADDLGFELELDTFEEESFLSDVVDRPEDLSPRPPVVTIMGHVDHGKTSLLDYIRQSNIIGGESGGITQHIGAYYVKTVGGNIVFLDTPGHKAFTAMRARGAKVTDIIVLVVAADDGAMPQTKEAINHARAANIPIVVAVNKIDKPEADPEKVKRELAELDLAPEEWGGETLLGHVSAKTGEGVEELLSLILLQSEMLELQGNPNRDARGTVIEAELDKSKGPVATVLIKTGSLSQGSQFVCGDYFGRVRAMLDHRGKMMKSAGPSVPVKLYGISGVPMAGDEFIVVKDEKNRQTDY